jgi:hypothetical protein
MAFDASLLKKVLDIGFSSPGGVWLYGRTTNSSTEVAAVGFFAGVGEKSKGANAMGVRLGDVFIVNSATGTTLSSTGRVTLHNVLNSTANVASTSLSSGFGASYDVTISAGSTI